MWFRVPRGGLAHDTDAFQNFQLAPSHYCWRFLHYYYRLLYLSIIPPRDSIVAFHHLGVARYATTQTARLMQRRMSQRDYQCCFPYFHLFLAHAQHRRLHIPTSTVISRSSYYLDGACFGIRNLFCWCVLGEFYLGELRASGDLIILSCYEFDSSSFQNPKNAIRSTDQECSGSA